MSLSAPVKEDEDARASSAQVVIDVTNDGVVDAHAHQEPRAPDTTAPIVQQGMAPPGVDAQSQQQQHQMMWMFMQQQQQAFMVCLECIILMGISE